MSAGLFFVLAVLTSRVAAEAVVDLESQYEALATLVCNGDGTNATDCNNKANFKFELPHAYICYPEDVSY